MSIDEAQITQIEQALQHGGLYVDPAIAGKIPPAMQAKIKAAIAKQDVPVKVIAARNTYEDPLYHGSSDVLAGTVHSDLGGDAAYFVANTASSTPRVDASTFGSVPYASEAASLASLEHPDDLGAQLLAAVEAYQAPGTHAAYEKAWDAYRAAHPETYASGSSHGHSSHDSSGHPVLIGGGLIALLVIAAVVVSRRRRTQVPSISAHVTDRPFTLPASVLSAITQTRDHEREESVDAEVLALGEAIDAATMGRSSSAAWQAALDHYDLARRIMQRAHSPADTVGALVLARRGHAALEAAVAGKAWSPTPTCYFNPVHKAGTTQVTWKGEHGSVVVPACAACAKSVDAGHEPEDILDFADGDNRRHYFDLDLGVWSRTGYGALETDLVKRLFATG